MEMILDFSDVHAQRIKLLVKRTELLANFSRNPIVQIICILGTMPV